MLCTTATVITAKLGTLLHLAQCLRSFVRAAISRAFQFAIQIDSILFVMRIDANGFESIRFVKKSAFRFTSCYAVFALNK